MNEIVDAGVNIDIELKGQNSIKSVADGILSATNRLKEFDKEIKKTGGLIDKIFKKRGSPATSYETLSRKERRQVDSFARKNQGQIAGRRLSSNIDAFDTGIVDYTAASRLAKQKYYQREVEKAYEERLKILKSQNQFLLTQSAGIKDFRTTLGSKDWKSFANDNRRHYEDVKADFTVSKWRRQWEEQERAESVRRSSLSSGLLLTADAGITKVAEERLAKQIEGTLEAEERIRAAKEEEAKAAEASAEAEKKGQKSSELTANQKAKYEEQDKRTKAYEARTEALNREIDRKKAVDNDAYHKFRNEHPERFATGGQNYNWNYQISRSADAVAGKLGQFGTGGRIAGDILSSAGALLKAPAAGVTAIFSKLAQGMIDFSKAATQAYAEIESIKTQLGVVFSSQTQADSMFGEIAQYAVKSPFGVQQTSEMAVLLKQSGVYASDLMKTLRMIGDTAGGNMEKMKRIANNYAQIVSIGKASMLDMRQFAYAGIPIFEAVSKELGVSQQELRKLISDGKVTSDIIEKVFKDLTGINGIFENATEKGAKTLKARLQNLKDAKQLAMSEYGELIINAGTKTGRDSPILEIISIVENIWQHLRENVETKNIQRDVRTIAKRNDKIDVLQKLIKETDNKELRTTYEKELAAELAKRNYDEERNAYAQSYDAKMGRLERAVEALNGYSIDDAASRLDTINRILNERAGIYNSRAITEAERAGIDYKGAYYETYKDFTAKELEILKPLYEELIAALKRSNELTEEEIRAKQEDELIKAQQSAFDAINKEADRSTSLMSSFRELANVYKDSDEYKEKQENERKKKLQEALNILKQISENTKEDGSVDVTKFSISQLNDYFNKGAFSAEEKLDVVSRNGRYSAENRNLLTAQVGYVLNDLMDFTKKNNSSAYKQLQGNSINKLVSLSTDDFYKQFPAVFDANKKIIESLAKNSDTGLAAVYDMYLNVLEKMLSRIGTDLQGVNVTPEMWENIKAGKEPDTFQPLYKRILASNLGIPATSITKSQNALELFSKNISSRNMAGSVLGAALNNGSLSVSDMTRYLTSYGTKALLEREKDYTYQIEWEEVRKNVKDFALQLRTSTDIIKSHKKSLEEERDTYLKLATESFTGIETDGKNTTWVTAKWLDQNKQFLSEDQIGVNAFGEYLKNANDEIVTEFKDGKAYDKAGKEISMEGLHIDADIYALLDKELKKIEQELFEANKIEAKSAILETERNRALEGNALTYLKLSNFSNRDFIDRNSNSIMSLYETKASNYYGEYYETFKDKLAAGDSGAAAMAQYILNEVYKEVLNMSPEQLKAFAAQAEKNRLGSEELSLKDQYDLMVNPKLHYGVNSKPHYGLGSENGYFTKKILSDLGWDKTTDLSALGDNLKEIQKNFSVEWLTQQFDKLGESIENVLVDSAKLAYISPFEKLGEDVLDISAGIKTWDDYVDDLGSSVRSIAGDLVKQTGQLIQQAGFSIVTASAMEHNWGGVAAGLLIAAAGGFASGIGNWLGNKNSSKDDKDETQKMQSLADQLKELLAQARADALYYEKNLRHKTALGLNEQFSYKSVNDAIITKKGDVIKTSPEDYLIATKTPQALGNNTVVQPNINFNVIDNVGVKVRQEQKQNPDGSIDIVAVIENAVGEYIASPKSDDAFNARQYRLNGRTAIM